ncbi:hypothetical protein NQ317_002900 [Molorchus minor]|uniref:CCHC-type domain-containing protein n=1 Tax=Molorchus minor TaxID=1323400 RepID=A0ABQ9JI95_9CUCU|nr:hypothetical protein NQ317_002900 [Molorchus minor]
MKNGLVDVKKEIDILKRKCECQKSGTVKVEEGYHHSSKIKPPTYDGRRLHGKLSLRGDALEILQTLNEDQHKNYEELVLQLEIAQLKGRNQRINENLQQYEADMALVCQAKRQEGTPELDKLRTRTPEREYRSNNAYNRSNFKDDVENLRQNIKDIQASLENIVEQADRRNQTTSFRRKVPLECWNCGEKGHIRPRCPRLGSEQAPVQRQVEDQENAN